MCPSTECLRRRAMLLFQFRSFLRWRRAHRAGDVTELTLRPHRAYKLCVPKARLPASAHVVGGHDDHHPRWTSLRSLTFFSRRDPRRGCTPRPHIHRWHACIALSSGPLLEEFPAAGSGSSVHAINTRNII